MDRSLLEMNNGSIAAEDQANRKRSSIDVVEGRALHSCALQGGGARGLKRAQAKVATAVLVAAALLAGCGSKPAAEPQAASFSAAMAVPSAVPGAEGKPADSGAAPSPAAPAASPAAAEPASPPAAQAGGDGSPSPAPQGMAASAAAEAQPAASAPPAPAQQEPKPVAAAQQPAAEPAPTAAPALAVEPAPAAAETPPAQPTPTPSSKPASNELKWSEFFDDDKQSTPSNKFWDLNGKTVQIKGFMGEVLSFDKHWFLLIPQPGAECPFDNGDETYWNKIMMVFVPKDTKLRYTTGPLQITGRLDVGIKIDESGYKTMFRLYDAKFEKIKE